MEIREGNRTRNSHIGVNGEAECGATNTHTVRRDATPERAERYVTCSKCRKAHGWFTIAGSFRNRSSAGLDSSAWGANRGR